MGLFIKNHGKSDMPAINWQNNQNGSDATATAINSTVNSIFGLLTKINDGKGGDGDDGDDAKVSNKTQEKIDAYQAQIDDKLKEAGVESFDKFDSKINESKKNQETLANNIKNINGKIDECGRTLSEIQAQINNLNTQLSSANTDDLRKKINSQIDELKANKKKVEDDRAANISDKEKVEAELKKEQIHQQEIVAQKAEVENLQYNIDKLKKQLPKEVSYNVKKETDDLAAFTSALKNFKENQNQETADALYNAYHGGHNGVQNKTAETAYKFIVSQYPQLFPKQ